MVPMRFVFRSKWWALLWAAGICLSAVEFAGGEGKQDDDSNGAELNLATISLPN
jgi:hypothetical protein